VDYGYLTQQDLNHYYKQSKTLNHFHIKNTDQNHYAKLVNTIKNLNLNKYNDILEKIKYLYTKNIFILQK